MAESPAIRRAVRPTHGPLAPALETLRLVERLAWTPRRAAVDHTATIPDIQFDLDPFIPRPQVIDGMQVRFQPVHTVFVTAKLRGRPSDADQRRLTDALAAVEQAYPWSPDGVFTHLAYGLPYFRKLPFGPIFSLLPRLRADANRFALEEAVPAPGDSQVRIEDNDLLFTFRSDHEPVLRDVLCWWNGSDKLRGAHVPSPSLACGMEFTSSRAMFVQVGLPRAVAANQRLPFTFLVNPRSALWMGFVDPQTSAPAPLVTFAGADGVRLTTAEAGDYFDAGAVQHLSHDILDLRQWYDVDDEFVQRVRLGHLKSLQRTLRTADGRPLHQRVDGAGFDALDMPDGRPHPKLQFSVFVPTANLFVAMRAADSGLDRFLTATRRQNFLVPPRRHRAFPLTELS